MRPEEADGTSPLSQHRCEIEKSPFEGECQRPGEVRYKGIILLCRPHAALLQLEDRAQAVLGSVFQMEEWLQENGSLGADEEYLGRIRHEREEALAALRLLRVQIRSARKEVLQQEGSSKPGLSQLPRTPSRRSSSQNSPSTRLSE